MSNLCDECYNTPMKKPKEVVVPELLFGFVLRARILLVGRDNLLRSRSRLQFILITEDISPGSRREILSDFRHYPVVQRYAAENLETFFGLTGTKVIGFRKSDLAKSLYSSLKPFRINKPVENTDLQPANSNTTTGEI